MKKIPIFCFFFLCAVAVWAEEESENTPIRLKNRGFEIALLRTRIGFSNSFITAKDVFQETMIIDLDKLTKDFRTELAAEIAPAAINFNWKDIWGFGFDLGSVSTFGNIEISGNLLQLNQTDLDKFGLGGAAYVDFGIPIFFHIRKLKIKLRPAVYLPLAYAEPGISYTFTEKANAFNIAINYNMNVYSIISLKGIDSESYNYLEILGAINTTTLGFDFNTEMEFPLYQWLDVGVNIRNIPLKPSLLNQYLRMSGEAFVDASLIDIKNLINGGKFPDHAYGYPKNFDLEYGTSEKKILRPFKVVSYAVFRPFKSTTILSFIPALGFAINPMHARPESIETGLKFRMDLANMFITTIGIDYEDRIWKNSINFIINLRAIEIDIGASVESQDFKKSWQGAGAGIKFGLKLGW